MKWRSGHSVSAFPFPGKKTNFVNPLVITCFSFLLEQQASCFYRQGREDPSFLSLKTYLDLLYIRDATGPRKYAPRSWSRWCRLVSTDREVSRLSPCPPPDLAKCHHLAFQAVGKAALTLLLLSPMKSPMKPMTTATPKRMIDEFNVPTPNHHSDSPRLNG